MNVTMFFTVAVSLLCFTPSAVAKAVNAGHPSSSPTLPAPHLLTWEEYWVATGQSKTSQTTIHLPADILSQEDVLVHSHVLKKRLIYGNDDRVRIDPASDGQKFPYSAQMKVSTGCSGVMVTARHVLTSAHCVHDGTSYLPSALFYLRAGYLVPSGDTKWFFVRRFFVPSQWKNLTSSNTHVNADWDDFDIAVLEMISDLGDKRDFISPGLSGLFCNNQKSIHGAGSKVEFVSFPDDKSDRAMWYVQTDIVTESRRLIYFQGDAWHGCSGAGMFAWDYDGESGKYERRVVGVLSGNRNTEALARVQGNFNVGVRLNPQSFALVCHWTGTWENCQQRYKKYLKQDSQQKLCRLA